jgi:homoserine dehydrogenase
MTFDLVLVGFGNVARRFVTLIRELDATLAREHDLSVRVVAIATKHHGHVHAPRGIDAVALANARTAAGSSRTVMPSVEFVREVVKKSSAAARTQRLVVVETTTLDITQGQPAIDHVRTALAGGAHVVTANKGPAAFAYRDLALAARRANRRFLFEGAVMDGIPIFNLVRETLPAVSIIGFRGVVNSTTNFILTAMETGQAFDEALAEMQSAGIAEADPTLDIDGWDAAAKTAALANVLMGARLTPRTIDREGITRECGRRAAEARAGGRRLKLVARARWEGARMIACVRPEELPEDDVLANLSGPQNAIVFETDLLGEIAIVQRGGNLTHTAYALVSDLLAIRRGLTNRRASRQSPPSARRRRTP